MSNKVLEVKKMKISFRTNNGIIKAVRDISFDLKKGETLAIVGESGSGKSVTSKAILGILAGNSIVDGGEILYDGKDLLKVPESELHKIRGDKIAMIFQDPLSSLDPIVKIGKQITEAMILKNRAARKIGKKEFNGKLHVLKNYMIEATAVEEKDKINQLISTFDQFNIKALHLENDYNESFTKAQELIGKIEDFLFLSSKNQKMDVRDYFKYFIKTLNQIKNPFLTNKFAPELKEASDRLSEQNLMLKEKFNLKNEFDKHVKGKVNKSLASSEAIEVVTSVKNLLTEVVSFKKPNFFRIGYYLLMNPEADITTMPIDDLNDMTLKYLEDNFLVEFKKYEVKAIECSYNKALENKKVVLNKLAEIKNLFSTIDFDKKLVSDNIKDLEALVNKSLDPLEVSKDSIAYTFYTSFISSIKSFYAAVKNNNNEERRYSTQKAKYDKLIASGKNIDWKLIPMKIIPLDDQLESIRSVIDRLINKYNEEISKTVDFGAKGIDLIDFFKDKASQVVYKLTSSMAKEQAIKLMDEVGIPDSRLRYNQYPFQFSGGMRQRIVIAIALAANPEILICDEPTTALDVTIQAQILELINKLKKERNLSIIFITHDLGVVANMADRIAVMYAGKIVEMGTSDDIFYSPAHPYTWALLSSMPDLDTSEKLEAIPGTPPNMIYPPVGDAFADRNKYALKIDFEKQPPLFKISETHSAATWLLHPNAPKVEIPAVIAARIKRMKESGGSTDE